MDNSVAAKPYSRLKGDPYRAYEALPEAVRRALQESLVDWCPLRAREWHLRLLHEERLGPPRAAFRLVQAIRAEDHAEVAAFARTWPKGAQAYPHLAAGATLQRYDGPEGLPAAEPAPAAPSPAAPGPARPVPARPVPAVRARAEGRGKGGGKAVGKGKAAGKGVPKARAGRRVRR